MNRRVSSRSIPGIGEHNVVFLAGTPVAGMPIAGMPVAGTPVAGTPVAGTPVGQSLLDIPMQHQGRGTSSGKVNTARHRCFLF